MIHNIGKSWTIDGISYSYDSCHGVEYGLAKSAVQVLSPTWLPFPALAKGYGKAHISVTRKQKADGKTILHIWLKLVEDVTITGVI